MFRTVIAYGELIFGFPILVASLLIFVPNLIFAATLGRSFPSTYEFVTNLIEGALSILCAGLIFRWLNVPLNFVVPIILAVVTYMWNSARKEANLALPATIGIAIGYFSWTLIR